MTRKTRNRVVWTVISAIIIFTMVFWTIGAAFM
jgi:hypothetical protein